MNALEFHKFVHEGVKIRQSEKITERIMINPLTERPGLVPDSHSADVNQTRSNIRWIKLVIVGGVIIFVAYVLIKSPIDPNYQNFLEKMRIGAKDENY